MEFICIFNWPRSRPYIGPLPLWCDTGLLWLTRLKKLKTLKLPKSDSFPASADLEFVLSLPTRTTLDLSGCKKISDSDLGAVRIIRYI